MIVSRPMFGKCLMGGVFGGVLKAGGGGSGGGGGGYEGIILATPGLLAYYRYEGLTVIPPGEETPPVISPMPQDSGPNDYHWTNQGSLVAGTAIIAGVVGEAIRYNGTGPATATFPSPATDRVPFMTDGVSFETWFRWRGSGTGEGSLFTGLPAEQFPLKARMQPTAGSWTFNVDYNVDAGAATPVSDAVSLPRDDVDWHYLAYTYERGVASKLYIDAVLVSTGAAPVALTCTGVPPTGLSFNYEDTHFDETAWYTGVLTPAMILAHYNAGVP